MYDRGGNPAGNQYVPELADERETCVLHLPQAERLLVHGILPLLERAPLFNLVLLISVELDVGDSRHEFVEFVLVFAA